MKKMICVCASAQTSTRTPPAYRFFFRIPSRAENLNLRQARERTLKVRVDFPGHNIAGIANIEPCLAPSQQWPWCACECTFADDSDIELRRADDSLLQAVHGMHHALKLRPVK